MSHYCEICDNYYCVNCNNSFDQCICPPKLIRQTNRPANLVLSKDDLKDLSVKLFPEEDQLVADENFQEDFVIHVNECDNCNQLYCICDQIVKCNMPGCKNKYYYNDADPAYEMCHTCEMAERKKELIHMENCPEDCVGKF